MQTPIGAPQTFHHLSTPRELRPEQPVRLDDAASLHATAPGTPSSAPVPGTPSSPPLPHRDFVDIVGETSRDWAHEGKKLGMLAGASALGMAIPLQLIEHAPTLALSVLNPVGIVGIVVVAALEEKYIGVGRRLGGLVAGAAGAVAGTVKAAWQETHPQPEPQLTRIQLPIQAPTGAPPKEALLPTLLHKAERKLLGAVPERTRTTEVAEGIVTSIATIAGAYVIPSMVGGMIGGPFALAMGTLAGPIIGLACAGLVENALGLGRATGELAGQVISKLRGPAKPDESAPPTPKPVDAEPPKDGLLKKGFMGLNHIMAEPVMGFLLDSARLTNRLFSEKPVQSMRFADRPLPQVDRQRIVDNFIRLAGIPGASGQEKPFGDEVCRQLDALGVPWERKADGTVIGTVPGTVVDAPTVVLSAHQDTVTPTRALSITNDGRRIRTDETAILGSDDRAGIAQILEGLQVVLEQGREHPEIKLVFTVGEESGLTGSSRLTPEDITTRPALGFVMDSTHIRDLNLTNDSVILNPKSVKYQFTQEDPVVQVVMHSMAEAGLQPRPIHAPIMPGAGSDANTPAFNSKNIHSIAVGTGMTDIHSNLENIKIDDLEQGARHVLGIITNSCDLVVDGDDIVPRLSLT